MVDVQKEITAIQMSYLQCDFSLNSPLQIQNLFIKIGIIRLNAAKLIKIGIIRLNTAKLIKIDIIRLNAAKLKKQ